MSYPHRNHEVGIFAKETSDRHFTFAGFRAGRPKSGQDGSELRALPGKDLVVNVNP